MTSKLIGAAALALLLSASVAAAQTTNYGTTNTGTTKTSVTSSTTKAKTATTTPGAPNTGAGGDMATNMALLGTSAVAALAGIAYLGRRYGMR